MSNLKAIIVDATGLALSKEEEQLFKSEKPAGFILFKRNCASKQQVTDLVTAMRECVGRKDVPVLIDQEGGSVSRLKQPEFREFPTARSFATQLADTGSLKKTGTGGIDPASAGRHRDDVFRITRENSYQMALDLIEMGITVNCAPVVDVPSPDCHKFLSESRTYGEDADDIAYLGEAVCRGLLDAGVTPVIKHIPGHGRAKVDSHYGLPETAATLRELSTTDFKPFKYLAQTDMKTALWAMAAHVVYSALDPDFAATVSRKVTDDVIRGYMGFTGVLLADDISMKALGGTLEDRVRKTLAAGMDLTMLCNASFEDRVTALSATPALTAEAAGRIAAAEKQRAAYIKAEKNERTGTIA